MQMSEISTSPVLSLFLLIVFLVLLISLSLYFNNNILLESSSDSVNVNFSSSWII